MTGKTPLPNPRSTKVSVAVPLYNEELVVDELYRRLRNVLNGLPGEYEIVFVDDGSTDGTRELLSAVAMADPRVKVVFLSRNFGHQAALSAGLDHVTGDVIILMDGDLQDTPESIPQFVNHYHRGYDVVYAIRAHRKEGWLLRTCYALFYHTISGAAEVPLPRNAGDFGLVSRRVLEIIRHCPERHRYLRGLRGWAGFRQVGVKVEREARRAGQSKYSWLKLLRLACDGIFSFSVAPLRMATWIGVITILGSMGFTLYAVVAHLCWQRSPAGFTALITAISFLAGVQLLCLGVIGEYVGRIYEQVKMRPMYVVDQVLTAESTQTGPPPLPRLDSSSWWSADRTPVGLP